MNFSRQALLGIGMIIGGSVMLYAMVQQIGDDTPAEPVSAMIEQPTADQAAAQPLTTDIDTEKRILAEKQKERAARVAEQERRAQQFMTEQDAAEAQALAKARAENQRYMENSVNTGGDEDSPEAAQNETATPAVSSSSEPTTNADNNSTASVEQTTAQQQVDAKRAQERERQAAAQSASAAKLKAEQDKKAAEQAAASNEAPKSPSDYTVKSGDGLIKLARQYNVPVAVLAQANNLSPSTSLRLGQTLTIPSQSQVERLEREAAAAERAREQKRQKEEALAKKSVDAKQAAQQKLREARQEVKATDAKGSFGVQVALADNQKKADDLAKKFQAAGYEVKTSATSRGVRVIVGPERGKVAALALKDKINSDPKVDTTGAWVLFWR